MAKLNQIIAVEKGIKSKAYAFVTDLYKVLQKPALFNGFSKTYERVDENGEELPAETQRVQFHAPEVLRSVERQVTEHMDTTARKDWSNCQAKADVVVDGNVIIAGAPVTYLLFLEKQMNDLHAFVTALPVLDETEDWTKDDNSGLFKTGATKTHRTKKVQRPIVLYDATAEHPAQTQLITEDVIVGFWKQVKQSGALPKPDRQALLERVDKLTQAIKQAREAANGIDEVAPIPAVGAAIFGFLLKD